MVYPAKFISSTIGLLILLLITGSAVIHSTNLNPFIVGDTVVVRHTLWPDTEKDDLVISRDGEAFTMYTIYTADGSSIDFRFSCGDNSEGYYCFEAYNAAADGSGFLFYKWPENRLYITYGIYQEFDPMPESVDFVNKEVLLKSRHSTLVPQDTLYLGNKSGYFAGKSNLVRVGFKEIWRLP